MDSELVNEEVSVCFPLKAIYLYINRLFPNSVVIGLP